MIVYDETDLEKAIRLAKRHGHEAVSVPDNLGDCERDDMLHCSRCDHVWYYRTVRALGECVPAIDFKEKIQHLMDHNTLFSSLATKQQELDAMVKQIQNHNITGAQAGALRVLLQMKVKLGCVRYPELEAALEEECGF